MPFKKGNIPQNKGQRGIIHHSEETKRKMSEGHKGQKQWNTGLTKETDERVLKLALKITGRPSPFKGVKLSEETCRKISESLKGTIPWNKGIPRSKETKDKISKTKTGVKRGPLPEETKKKISLAQKGRVSERKGKKRPPFSKEWKENISKAKMGEHVGEKNPNWRGGTSFDPYSPKFNRELKKKIRQRDNNQCVLCEAIARRGFYLHVHHIDYDKKNYDKKNLIILCPPCHSKTNFNRKYWRMFFNDFMYFIYPAYPFIPPNHN